MAATCGLRLGEVRAIRKCQIRDREGILIVDGFMKRTGERTCFNKKGSISDRKIRCVPIPESTLKEIRSYTEKKKLSKDEYLFLNEIGCVYTAGHLERTFRQVLGRSGIETKGKRYVPHSLRFTYVTRMRTMFSVEDVRKIAGHASSEMTEYYTRMAISDMCRILQPAREIVNELFS